MRSSERLMRRILSITLVFSACVFLAACASSGPSVSPLEAARTAIELERFMGDWYVIGSIPITIPLFSEEGAHNAVESYELREDGTILTTYSFRKGAFDGKQRRFTPKGWVYDHETNTEWRMQFVWPFKAAYLIAWVGEDYGETIIGVPDRDYVWIMARSPEMSERRYEELLERVRGLGYDTNRIQRIPQRWP
jgi:apolipoprotein D and lipocalin family protein